MSDLDTKEKDKAIEAPEKKPGAVVSFFVYEGTVESLKQIIHWLIAALVCVLLIASVAFYANNRAWMKYTEQQAKTEDRVDNAENSGLLDQTDSGTGR